MSQPVVFTLGKSCLDLDLTHAQKFLNPNVSDVHIPPVQTRGTQTGLPSQSFERDTSHTDSVVVSVVNQTVT